MRTLKYAILGLLNEKSMTGYDLMLEFEETLNEFWNARHSQIYPELKKLTEEGMITYEIEIAGTMLEKKLYTITKAGREEFRNWLAVLENIQATPKDVFRLRTFFIHNMDPVDRILFLEDGLKRHRKRLEHLEHNQKKFQSIPDTESDAFGDYLVLMGAIMREKTTCLWIQECIRLCEK